MRQWELDPEAASFALYALDSDGATHGLDHSFTDTESNAGALDGSLLCSQSIEGLE
jgi:hypothetical protein